MTSLLPIVEDLLDATDDCERARWLLMTPSSVLYRDQMPIRAALVRAGVRVGLTYLAAEIAAFCAVRRPDGTLRPEITHSREIARADLLAVAGVAATLEAAQ
ncbi:MULTISPECIES: hypothetical protein [unclassified Ensifer]|uniref:hypothetical protein n=1 Tax=unclassified Ensifer TaxID=2633371 RepID=UPI0007109624|nr:MULTISPECIES: hypothetical protein [unclassified Ensifer]KQW62875.1 hypothetical protein ASD02_01775 [Ensifer sp. Root1252]KRC83696.1 hypothetical protein ASE32_01765 [Ensifer sp. Root231]KRD04049.1 hypothetical protein ASE47_00425 [Ensifer sp. Root258]